MIVLENKFNLIVGFILLSIGNYIIYEADFLDKVIWLGLILINLWYGLELKQIKESAK